MLPKDNCNVGSISEERRLRFKNNKLVFLKSMKEMLERRMAALDATILKLEEQIQRSSNVDG